MTTFRFLSTWSLGVSLAIALLSGCVTKAARRADAITKEADATQADMAEESRTLTTAIVDTLAVAPSNAPTQLAQRFARADQQLEGVPVHRIDVVAALAGQPAAANDVEARLATVERLASENAANKAALQEAQGRLQDMGRLYEAERNKHIVKRVWHWLVATLGLGGIIALCILCPAVIPIFARILAWIVGKVPALAGAIGVVGKGAFDSVVKGVGDAREAFAKERPEALKALDTHLAIATDKTDKALIESRRGVVRV